MEGGIDLSMVLVGLLLITDIRMFIFFSSNFFPSKSEFKELKIKEKGASCG